MKADLKNRLLNSLREYAQISIEAGQLEEILEVLKGDIEAMREETGDDSISVDGFTVTRVTGGVTRTLNRKRLLALISPDKLDSCYDEKPKADYTLVTTPSSRKR